MFAVIFALDLQGRFASVAQVTGQLLMLDAMAVTHGQISRLDLQGRLTSANGSLPVVEGVIAHVAKLHQPHHHIHRVADGALFVITNPEISMLTVVAHKGTDPQTSFFDAADNLSPPCNLFFDKVITVNLQRLAGPAIVAALTAKATAAILGSGAGRFRLSLVLARRPAIGIIFRILLQLLTRTPIVPFAPAISAPYCSVVTHLCASLSSLSLYIISKVGGFVNLLSTAISTTYKVFSNYLILRAFLIHLS